MLAGLRAIVGAEHVCDGGAAVDGVVPRWSAAPATIEQVATLVALAYDEGLVVVPRGGGTALELGHPPPRVDLVVEMRRLDAVLLTAERRPVLVTPPPRARTFVPSR